MKTEHLKEVFYTPAHGPTEKFAVQVGDLIDGRKECNNDMHGYLVQVIDVNAAGHYVTKVMDFNPSRYSSRRDVGDIWNMLYMKGKIHPGCKVLRGVLSWRGEFE